MEEYFQYNTRTVTGCNGRVQPMGLMMLLVHGPAQTITEFAESAVSLADFASLPVTITKSLKGVMRVTGKLSLTTHPFLTAISSVPCKALSALRNPALLSTLPTWQ